MNDLMQFIGYLFTFAIVFVVAFAVLNDGYYKFRRVSQ